MKKILFTVLALTLIIGLIGAGASALFWDTETSSNDFTAGTIDLRVDGSDDFYGIYSFNVACLAPTDSDVHVFDITNDGCLNCTFTMSVSAYTEAGGDNPEPEIEAEIAHGYCVPGPPPFPFCNDPTLDEQLLIQIWRDDNNGVLDPGEVVLINDTVVNALSQIAITPLAIVEDLEGYGAEHQYIGFRWEVLDLDPMSVNLMSNLIMGDDVAFDIEFRCDQQTLAPAAMSIDDGSKTHPSSAYIGDIVPVCVDVTNSGGMAGTVKVDYEALDGVLTVWSDSKTVLIAGGGTTETVCMDWDTTGVPADTYQINVSIPGDSEGPNMIVITAAPVRLQPGTYWVYDVDETATGVGCVDPPVVQELNTWTKTLAQLDVIPSDSSLARAGPDPVLCNRSEWAYSQCTSRKPSNCPGVIHYLNSTAYSSVADGTTCYRTLDGWIFLPCGAGATNLRNEWGNHNYTLTSLSGNIGEPYTLGSQWEYRIFSGAVVSGAPLSPWTWMFLAEVVAQNVSVTVPAGTFTDCFQIDTICDWGTTVGGINVGPVDGVYDPAELTITEYHSATAAGMVKVQDFLTMDCESGCNDGSINTWGNTCQGAPSNMVETQQLASYSLIWA